MSGNVILSPTFRALVAQGYGYGAAIEATLELANRLRAVREEFDRNGLGAGSDSARLNYQMIREEYGLD
jgi:hypothetical protein